MSALDPNSVIAVVGAGAMGGGVAQVAAAAGHPVRLYDQADGAARAAIDRIDQGLDKLVQRGRISAEEQQALVGRIQPVERLEAIGDAALVIEAIVEDLNIKQRLFRELETLCPKAILASNTSSLSITAIGSALERPQRLLGMHFFNPAPIMKLVEIISGLASDPALAETLFDTATAWGKLAVHARSTPGFIVNRVARPYYAEALRLLQEGAADAATLDAIYRDGGGFRMGPFELMDLIGQDVNYAVTESVHHAYYGDPRFTPSLIQKALVDAGWLGRKSGRGFYDYREGADNPAPAEQPPCAPPREVTVIGTETQIAPWKALLESSGLAFQVLSGEHLSILCDGFTLRPSDGHMATVRAHRDNIRDLVLYDLCLDLENTARITLCAADQASPRALEQATGLLQALGKRVTVIDDVPGMVVLRTVAMLANEGADAVNQGVCDAAAVDTAMQAGVNYPLGPLAWADRIGLRPLLKVLKHLQKTYGEDRYRPSPLLLRKVAAGEGFHD